MVIMFVLLWQCDQQAEVIDVPGLSATASSKLGMVSASHPIAVRVGQEILAKGGNAADAAVAVGFALSVVEPSMSGLGGRMQTILRLPDGSLHGIDATTQAPLGYKADTTKDFRYGYKVIGVPGVVKGLTKLLANHGSMPLKEVMKPAIKYAAQGFELLEDQVQWHQRSLNTLKKFPGSASYFLKDGLSAYQPGEVIVQKDLAATLQKIADHGPDIFYKGEIAQKIVADVQANGGFLNLESLATYEARDAEILEGSYRGHDIHALFLPSYGAITIEILQLLEHLPMADYDDAQWAAAFALAINRAYEDRPKQRAEAAKLISKPYASQLAQQIQETMAPQKLGMTTDDMPESWTEDLGHTTHFSVADQNGMVISSTQSLGPLMGSKVATPGLGFLYAVTLGPYLKVTKAGVRASSHISPIIISKDDQPFLVIGGAGGARIISAITEVTSRFIDQQKTLPEALAAARIHPVLDTVDLEVHQGIKWPDHTKAGLESLGFVVDPIDEPFKFGRVHAICYDPETKNWIGAADPDGEGRAGGPERLSDDHEE